MSQPPSLENPFVGSESREQQALFRWSQPPSLENPFVGVGCYHLWYHRTWSQPPSLENPFVGEELGGPVDLEAA